MVLAVFSSTAFSNVKGIIDDIPGEIIFIEFKKWNGLGTSVKGAL